MAGSFNKYLSKTLKTLDTFSGKNAANWANKAKVLHEAEATGLNALRAKRIAKVEAGRTTQTRVKAGIGAVAVAGTGFLGAHKYMQHQDKKLMERIDKMYRTN